VHISGRTITFIVLITASPIATACGSTATHHTASQNTAREKSVTSAAIRENVIAQIRVPVRKPVATISGHTITHGMLEHWASIDTHAQIGAPRPPNYTVCIQYLRSTASSTTPQTMQRLIGACRHRYDELSKQTLSTLIHNQWLIDEAAEEGLKVDRAKLKRESSLSGPHGDEVRQTLANTGETTFDLRLKLAVAELSDRIYRKLEREVPQVSRTSVSGYYRRHKKRFVAPEQRDLYILRTPSDAAATKAKQEIEGGTSFATLANRTTLTQPGSTHDGLLLGLRFDNWPEPPLIKAIFNSRLNVLGGPVKIPFGYYVFEVIRRVPARQRTLAEAWSEVAMQLHQLMRNQIRSHFIAAFRRKWRSRTNCRPNYVVEYCRQYKTSKGPSRQNPNIL
jgi:parvulin-like peptidyl-prolyl isomerase